MNNFDLSKVHELIRFQDIYKNENEYMNASSNLPRIELETEPLYVIKPNMPVLFTTKLRYYRLLVENEINRHINDANNLVESCDSEELTKFVLKKTSQSVDTLVNEANRFLYRLDNPELYWKSIISDNPQITNWTKPMIEIVVFMHYVIAELTRCWLELQDRYAYVIGQTSCYDVSLFYSSKLNRFPDKEFEIIRSVKYEEEAKHFKKCRTDCCFLYDNDEYFAIAIQEFTNKLRYHKLIPDDMDCKKMESLFSGRSCRTKYKWLGDNHILTHIIKGLTDGEKPIITTWPKGTSKWEVVSCRFVDKEGNALPNIRQEKARKKSVTIVNDAINALAGYL